MRLSAWGGRAPGRDGIHPKAVEAVGLTLGSLGAEANPHCWITWGDESGSRWTLMAPSPTGLAVVNVRAGGPGEGSRVSGRLIRWSKVQVGELAAESERGHRMVMFQVEGQPIRGTDSEADDVAAFALLTLAGMDGRTLPDLDAGRRAAAPTRPAGKAASKAKAPAGQPPRAKAGGAGPITPAGAGGATR